MSGGRQGGIGDPSSRTLIRCEDELWQKLSDRDRETLENYTEKQQKKDAQVMERWPRVRGPSEDVTASHAAQCKAKLKSMTRVPGNTEQHGAAR